MNFSPSLSLVCSFFTAFVISFISIPSIIRIAEIKHLFDMPDGRKQHGSKTPTLGGIAIFAGVIFSLTFWATQNEIVELQYIICSVILLFFMGIKDDLFNLVAYKKLLGQLMASFILVHCAGIRITTFYGLFGIYDISMLAAYGLSLFAIVVITNSFNLIDGLDGLAASVGIISSASFGLWFYAAGANQYAILACCTIGALLGFLFYNRSPAKIFMGDTGSLIVGIIISILAIKYIEMNRILERTHPHKILSVPVATLAVLVLPLFDTLRVFTIRVLQGRSPLSADRNHIHHLLQSLGFSHNKATLSLVCFNLIVIGSVFGVLPYLRGEVILAGLLAFCLMSSSLVAYAVRRKTLGRVSNTFAAPDSKEAFTDEHIQ